MRQFNASVPLRVVLGLMFVACVESSDDRSDSGLQAVGASGMAATAGDTGAAESTGGGDESPCTAPHDSSTSTSGAASTAGESTGAPDAGDSGDEDGGSSGSGDESDGDEAGETGESDQSTGGADETGGAGETGGEDETGGGDESSGGSTGDAGESTGGGEPAGPSFAAEVWPMLDASCGCHMDKNGAGKLKLGQGGAYDNLVGQPSSQLPAMLLVEPGSSETSYLWHKMANTHKSVGGKGKVMPPGGKLGKSELDVVKQWIDGGAQP